MSTFLKCALLQAMAGSYKQALYFPFMLSQEHWGNVGRENGKGLEPILQSEVMRRWTTALSDMIFPLQRWQGWMAKLAALLTDKHQVQHYPALLPVDFAASLATLCCNVFTGDLKLLKLEQ